MKAPAPASTPRVASSSTSEVDHYAYLSPAARRTSPDGIRALFYLEKPEIVSFLAGRPNPAAFPFKSISMKLNPPMGSSSESDEEFTIDIDGDDMVEALSYGPTHGAPRFHKFCTDFSAEIHHRPIHPSWRTTVGAGCQDLIAKAIKCLVAPGDHVLCESPAYSGALALLNLAESKIHEVPLDSQGVSPKALRAMMDQWPAGTPKPKLLYTVPIGSNPSGTSSGVQRKLEILQLAKQHGFLILEDDPYYFLATQREPSYFELETQVIPSGGLVVRFDSFSKVLASGLRLGFATGPKVIIDAMDVHTATVNLQPSSMSQAMAYGLLNKWGVEGFLRHASEVAKFYEARRVWFEELAHKHLDGLASWISPTAGMFLWINLGMESYAFTMVRALSHGVIAVPGRAFMATAGANSTYVRVSFSVIEPDAADEGFRRLAGAIREAISERDALANGTTGAVTEVSMGEL